MRALKPDKPAVDRHEIHITIHVPDRYIEVIEVHRSRETGAVFVQVILVKEIETLSDPDRNLNTPFRRLEL